jgi:hypothetical protein
LWHNSAITIGRCGLFKGKKTRKSKEKKFQRGLDKLSLWVLKKKFDLEFDYCVQDEFRSDNRCITISTRQGLENQLYSLLHECGHLLLNKNENSYAKKYPSSSKMLHYNSNKLLERSARYKVDVLSEEIDAWRKGKELANRLKIEIDEEKFYSVMTECVYSYITALAR